MLYLSMEATSQRKKEQARLVASADEQPPVAGGGGDDEGEKKSGRRRGDPTVGDACVLIGHAARKRWLAARRGGEGGRLILRLPLSVERCQVSDR